MDKQNKFQADYHQLISSTEWASLSDYLIFLQHDVVYSWIQSSIHAEALLDIGCNTGYGTRRLAGAASAVIGLDVSIKALRSAHSQNPDRAVDYCAYGGGALPFRYSSFDFILSLQVIEHLQSPVELLREALRVMRPDGVMIISSPNASLRLDASRRPWNPFHKQEFSASELEALLAPFFNNIRLIGVTLNEPYRRMELRRYKKNILLQRWLHLVSRLSLQGPTDWPAQKWVAWAIRARKVVNRIQSLLFPRTRQALRFARISHNPLVRFTDPIEETSLDLVAICSNSPDRLTSVANTLDPFL